MPTKHDHLKDEICDILASVSGLTVVRSMTSGQEPARPFARPRFVGWQTGRVNGEAVTVEKSAMIMIEVFISHAGGEEGIEEERNRLDNLLEHAFDVYQIASYADAAYECSNYMSDYKGASGVFDQNQNAATFVATVEVKYFQTPII